MRGSVTFDNDTCFAWHGLLRGLLSAGAFFCDAYAPWQKGGVENANGLGLIRRWLPGGTDLDEMDDDDQPHSTEVFGIHGADGGFHARAWEDL